MNEYQLAKRVADLERDIDGLRRATSHLPLRTTAGGGLLPDGGEAYEMLMIVDDAETIAWSLPRFSVIAFTTPFDGFLF